MSLPMNQGAAALVAAGTISGTAKRLDVAERTVASWRTGRVVPSDGSRQTIKRVLGIEPALFDRAIVALPPPGAPAEPPPPREALVPRETARERLEAQIEPLREQRSADLTTRERT
jgi:hypothetical protein